MYRFLILLFVFLGIACGDGPSKKGSFASANGSTNNANNSGANGSVNQNTGANGETGANATTVTSGPCAESDLSELDFGGVTTGERRELAFGLHNCSSDTPIELASTSIDGAFELIMIPSDAAPGETVSFVIGFAPQTEGPHTGKLQVEFDGAVEPLEINLRGDGFAEVDGCVETVARLREANATMWDGAITTDPNTSVELSGASSTSRAEVTRFDWSIVESPSGSTALLSSNTTMAPTFTPDLPGNYRFELSAFDAEGRGSCDRAQVALTVLIPPSADVHVQLVWSTPADSDPTDTVGTDLDLHYKHPAGTWDNAPYDINWRNKTADWGQTGSAADDPSMDIDDSDGAGPENVNHSGLEDIFYDVGVFYYAANGLDASYATVRIYVDGALAFQRRDVLMNEGDFWHVASIGGGDFSIVARDRTMSGFP